jgi:hypothetical protein
MTYSVAFYKWPWEPDERIKSIIPDNFLFRFDDAAIKEADVVVFHMPSVAPTDPVLANKPAHQLWVFWSTECEVHYSWQFENKIFDLFDIRMTYKQTSDVPMLYLLPGYENILRKAPVQKTAFINAFISSDFDQSGRLKLLKELMQYFDVHSYGKVLQNKYLAADKGIFTKANVISQYKFTIAFENAIAADYVTEKLYEPLIMGSVPVYLGAPNVDEFVPGNNCYINAGAFSSGKQLAEYLMELNENDELYESFLSWKELPFKESFLSKMELSKIHPFTKLCALIEDKFNAK